MVSLDAVLVLKPDWPQWFSTVPEFFKTVCAAANLAKYTSTMAKTRYGSPYGLHAGSARLALAVRQAVAADSIRENRDRQRRSQNLDNRAAR